MGLERRSRVIELSLFANSHEEERSMVTKPFDMRLDDGSRMNREVHVRFCESAGVRLPRATHLHCDSSFTMMEEARPFKRSHS